MNLCEDLLNRNGRRGCLLVLFMYTDNIAHISFHQGVGLGHAGPRASAHDSRYRRTHCSLLDLLSLDH